MKFLWIALLIICQVPLQLDGMFSFLTRKDLGRVRLLDQKIQDLAQNNPTNSRLQSYVQSISHVPVDEINCYEREKNAQTLLFPLNTNMMERVSYASCKNLPEVPWWNLSGWYKVPVAQCYNAGSECKKIMYDAADSLRFSDAVVAGLGYLCAEGIVRRLHNENSMFGVLAGPLVIAGPLAAICLKKCRFDTISFFKNNAHGVPRQNEQRTGNTIDLIREQQDDIDDINVHKRKFNSTLSQIQYRSEKIAHHKLLDLVHIEIEQKLEQKEKEKRQNAHKDALSRRLAQNEVVDVPSGLLLNYAPEWHAEQIQNSARQNVSQSVVNQNMAAPCVTYHIMTGKSLSLSKEKDQLNNSQQILNSNQQIHYNHSGSVINQGKSLRLPLAFPLQQKVNYQAADNSIAEALLNHGPNAARIILKKFPK